MCLGLLTFKEGTVAAFVIVVTRNLSNLGISFLCVWGPPSFGYWVSIGIWTSFLMFNIANFIFRSGPDVATFPPHCTLKVQAQQGAGGLALLRPHRPLAEAGPGRQAALMSSLGRYCACWASSLACCWGWKWQRCAWMFVCSCALVAEESRHAEVAFGEGQELLLQSASAGLQVRLSDQIDKTWSS